MRGPKRPRQVYLQKALPACAQDKMLTARDRVLSAQDLLNVTFNTCIQTYHQAIFSGTQKVCSDEVSESWRRHFAANYRPEQIKVRRPAASAPQSLQDCTWDCALRTQSLERKELREVLGARCTRGGWCGGRVGGRAGGEGVGGAGGV